MIRKKWNGDELVLSVETEDEFWKAVRRKPRGTIRATRN